MSKTSLTHWCSNSHLDLTRTAMAYPCYLLAPPQSPMLLSALRPVCPQSLPTCARTAWSCASVKPRRHGTQNAQKMIKAPMTVSHAICSAVHTAVLYCGPLPVLSAASHALRDRPAVPPKRP